MNALKVSFLLITDMLVLGMLVALLAGCVTTPQQYRNGDFVSHMAAAEPQSRTAMLAVESSPRVMTVAQN